MSVSATPPDTSGEIVLSVSGRFDFSAYQDFRDALGNPSESNSYTVDLSHAEYMDSSALGMLLLMREKAGGDSARVRIRVSNPEIRKVLEVANFGRMFELVE